MMRLGQKYLNIKFAAILAFVLFLVIMYIGSTARFRIMLADYYTKRQDYNKAVDLYRKLLRKEAVDARSDTERTGRFLLMRFKIADLLLKVNKFSESARLLGDIHNIDSGYKFDKISPLASAEDCRKFGAYLLYAGLDDLALRQFYNMISLEPENPLRYYQLALACRRQGRGDEASLHFKKAAELADKERGYLKEKQAEYLADLYYNLAADLEKEKDLKGAEHYYENSIAVDSSGGIDAYYSLRRLYIAQGREGDVRALEDEIRSLKPEYKVDHKFSDKLTLLGYSLCEEEFKLFNKGRVNFFWHIVSSDKEIDSRAGREGKTCLIGNFLYTASVEDNLAPNFGFELDNLNTDFPYGWDYCKWGQAKSSRKVVSGQGPLPGAPDQKLLLIADKHEREPDCKTYPVSVDADSYYLQAAQVKNYGGKIWAGVQYGPERNNDYITSDLSDGEWRYICMVFTPPDEAECFNYRLLLVSYHNDARAYFDDVILMKLELPV